MKKRSCPISFGDNIMYDVKAALRRNYGITPEQYNTMLKMQHGVCAICHERPSKFALAVDHDHKTGKLRKLLCSRCNTGLGMFRDDPRLIAQALIYLAEHGKEMKFEDL